MKVLDKSYDKRINADCLLLKISLKDYYEIAKLIINNNKLQRKRVRSSNNIYNLLKRDLMIGCSIPPLVLAIKNSENCVINVENVTNIDLNKHINNLMILDGLQRTYTICEIFEENPLIDNFDLLNDYGIIIQLYLNISYTGILYRMLTLNTGQTPMSIRQQIEMIYYDYSYTCYHKIQLLKEQDNQVLREKYQHKFSDMIDGFTSYLTRDYLTLDRFDILENMKTLEFYPENKDYDEFHIFTELHYRFVCVLDEITHFSYIEDSYKPVFKPYGYDCFEIFKTGQSLTGFGAAVGQWIKDKTFYNLQEIFDYLYRIDIQNDDIYELIRDLDLIKKEARRIGNSQRFYFYCLFKALFDRKDKESFLNFNVAIRKGKEKYDREML